MSQNAADALKAQIKEVLGILDYDLQNDEAGRMNRFLSLAFSAVVSHQSGEDDMARYMRRQMSDMLTASANQKPRGLIALRIPPERLLDFSEFLRQQPRDLQRT